MSCIDASILFIYDKFPLHCQMFYKLMEKPMYEDIMIICDFIICSNFYYKICLYVNKQFRIN
jgi:hypothetical protein